MKKTTAGGERAAFQGRSKHLLVALCALMLAIGVAACGATDDAISFAKYIEATVDVLETNGMEPELELDCDGSDETKTVTCTSTTTDGQSIESTGENLGEDDATLVVEVDGKALYDGLLEDARNS